MTRGSENTCLRCQAPLPGGARYCHLCGVSVSAAASGEFSQYDLARFFNYALDLLCIAGIDGYFKLVNPAFERVLGYTAAELLQIPFTQLIHPEDRNDTVAEVNRLATGRETICFQNRFRCKDGSYRRLEWTSYPEGATGLLYAVARDVTEWDRSERQVSDLHESGNL
ncbi:MAG: PAS domain S-box protein [Gemmatimonadota bacterium]|nr:PAS domain S-box protein [Gemmatimonadota bacterium]